MAAFTVGADRLMVLEWDGATLAVVERLAQLGVMPNLARLLGEGAFWRLRWRGLGSPTAAWATLRSGCGPERHGVWDESRLDHRRGWIVPVDEDQLPCPALPELLPAGARAACRMVTDRQDAAGIWCYKPESLEGLVQAAGRTERVLATLVQQARRAAASSWRLLEIRFQVLALLEHRIWHLMGVEDSGVHPQWITAAQRVFRAFDQALGWLLELADRDGAAVALCSPYGLVPFREKITLVELLRQHGLLEVTGGLSKAAYCTQRFLWRRVRRLVRGSRRQTQQGVDSPVGGLLPIDWHRSRAVTLHGQHAALVYLNTPERFGTRVLSTAASQDAALAETLDALGEVRHPVTGERLFVDVYSTAARFGGNPLECGWPDVVATTASGFLTRQKPDHRRHLLRADPSLAAVQGSDGMLLVRSSGVEPGQRDAIELTDVAPMLLGLLGTPCSTPAATMG